MLKYTTFQHTALFILRLIIAAIFAYGGYGKFFLWSADPASMGMGTAMYNLMLFLSIAEPIGAVAIAVGFLTRITSLCNAIVMAGSIYIMQFQMGIGFVTPTAPGWEFNLLVLCASIVLMAFGPGKYSVYGMWQSALDRPLVA